MALDADIDPKSRFDRQVASGLAAIQLGGDAKRLAFAQEIDRNKALATEFFKAEVFASVFATDDENICRAVTCLHTIRGKITANKKSIEDEFNRLKGEIRKNGATVRKQLKDLVEPATASAAQAQAQPNIALMSQPALPAVQRADSAPGPAGLLATDAEKRLKRIAEMIGKDSVDNLTSHFSKRAILMREKLDPRTLGSDTVNKLDTAAVSVRGKFNSCMIERVEEFTRMIRAVDEAHKNFRSAFQQSGQAKNERNQLITKIISAGLGKIPVAGSILAAVAETIGGMIKHDVDLPASNFDYFKPDMSHLSGVGKLVHTINTKVKSATSVGVNGDKIVSLETLEDLLLHANAEAKEVALRELDAHLKLYFSDGGDVDDRTRHGFSRAVVAIGTAGKSTDRAELQTGIQRNIDRDRNELEKGITNYFEGIRVFKNEASDKKNLTRFVTLMLWASYIREMVTPEKFDAGFNEIKNVKLSLEEPAINALIALEIVQHKGKQHYADVVKAGRLPYDGNPVHDVGLILFFQWYYKLNPFEIVGPNKLTGEKLKQDVTAAIASIGNAIEKSKSRSLFQRKSSIQNENVVLDAQRKLMNGP